MLHFTVPVDGPTNEMLGFIGLLGGVDPTNKDNNENSKNALIIMKVWAGNCTLTLYKLNLMEVSQIEHLLIILYIYIF